MQDLGLGETPLLAGRWLRKAGSRVIEGDGLLEIIAANATIELPSPCSGKLLRTLVLESEPISVGQRLALIAEEE